MYALYIVHSIIFCHYILINFSNEMSVSSFE
nr:MAG TPA: hypothetical protein [Caudoviricetes sp.]